MKLFILVIALLFTAQSFAQGVLEITEPDLSNIMADDKPVEVKYLLKNTGTQPILVTRVVPTSSYLKVDWEKTPILPGATGNIKVTFTPSVLPETFNFLISVFSNARDNRVILKFAGRFKDNPDKPALLYKQDMDGVKFKENYINFFKIFTWQTVTDTIEYYNTNDEPASLTVKHAPKYITTTFIPQTVAPKEKGIAIITFDASQKNDYGYIHESIIVGVNESKHFRNRISVSAELAEDFSKLDPNQLKNPPVASFEQTTIDFGELKQGEKANSDFNLKNNGKTDLIIRKVKASCGCTAITLGDKTIAPGKSTIIRSTFDSNGREGKQRKSITVITNDPKQPQVILYLNGNVIK